MYSNADPRLHFVHKVLYEVDTSIEAISESAVLAVQELEIHALSNSLCSQKQTSDNCRDMANNNPGQALHLLELPFEIRLEVYTLIFRTAPMWFTISGLNLERLSCWHRQLEKYLLPYHANIQSRCLFQVCSQIRAEAIPVFISDSPLDLHTGCFYTELLPLWLLDQAKHIICRTRSVARCFGSATKLAQFSCLKTVTIIDGSKLFPMLTHGRYWPVPDPSKLLAKQTQNESLKDDSLKDAILALRSRGVERVVIRSAKHRMARREIVLRFREARVCVLVCGIRYHWNEMAEAQVLARLAFDPKLTEFEFLNEWERTEEGPYDFNIDYSMNGLERNARKLNSELRRIARPERVSIRNGKFVLLDYTFNSAILTRLITSLQRQSCHYISVSRDGPDGRRIDTHEKESSLKTRVLKAILYRFTGQRKALDEAVEICEFLALA